MVSISRKNKNTDPEILVYIKQEPLDKVVKRHIETSSDGLKNWVTIEPETEKKAGWKVDVTGCIRPSENGLYCEVIRGSLKAIKIDTTNNTFTLSKLTNDEAQEVIKMKIFKAHYGSILKDLLAAIKPILIILAVAVAISCAISGYDAYMISKIPAIAMPMATPTPGVIG